MAEWSDLTKDVLELITSKLELPDYHRFGAVCKSWHSAAKAKHYLPAKHMPWLLLGEDEETHKRAFFSLSESKHYYMDIPELYGHVCCGSSFGWLFTVDRELNGHLLNPLTRERLKLPPLPIEDLEWHGRHRDLLQRAIVRKTILCCDPSGSRDFTVVILCGLLATMAFWRRGDPNWSMVDDRYRYIEDITYFKGNLYALTTHYAVIVVDLGPHPKMTMVCPPIPEGLQSNEAYLVDFGGESLVLIHRIVADYSDEDTKYHFVTKEFHVFELELERRQYHKRRDINGSAFFVGSGGSLVIIDPSQVPGCVPDRICYTGTVHYPIAYDNTGFYDMVTETIGEYGASKLLIPFGVAATWFTPNPWAPKGED